MATNWICCYRLSKWKTSRTTIHPSRSPVSTTARVRGLRGLARATMVPESGLIKGAGKVNFERDIPLVSSRTKPKIADRQNTRMHDPDVQNLASILAEMDEISRKVDMMCANLECLVAGTETGVGDKWRNTPPRLTLESHGLRKRPR